MSFKSMARKVRDSERSMGYRIIYLNAYMTELANYTRLSCRELFKKYTPTKEPPATEAELLLSLEAMETLREQYRVLRAEAIQAREVERMQRPIRPRKGDLRAVGDIELPTDGGKSS